MKQLTISLILFLSALTGIWAQPNPPAQGGGFVTNDTLGCAPYVVNLFSFAPGAVSQNWDFGNGTTSILANPTVIYLNSGVYTIILDVEYADGTTEQFVRNSYIEVSENPAIDFNLGASSICANNNEINVQNNATVASQFLWDFGDGYLTTDAEPTHVYSSAGNYNVSFFATNTAGCTSDTSFVLNIVPVVQAAVQTIGASTACDSSYLFSFDATSPNIQNYNWEFSDGSQLTGSSVQHSFNTSGAFDLTLYTTDQNGCVDTSFTSSIAEIIGYADNFIASTNSVCAGSSVTFTSNTNGATSVDWDFGDGNQGTGATVTHTYQNPGQYDVTMTTAYPGGCIHTYTDSNFVIVSGASNVSMTISDTSVCVGESIALEAISANMPNVKWFFGDGMSAPAYTPIATQQYTIPGNFNIRLIYGAAGCSDTIYQPVIVSQPISDFQNVTFANCAPASIQFNDMSTNAVSWNWTFSNGQTSLQENPQITFNQSGSYDAELVVVDQNGCTDTSAISNAVVISNNTPSGFQHATFSGCAPFSVSLYDYSIGSGLWNWNFGDGNSSNLATPNHVYTLPGEYVVSLNTIDSLGCGVQIDTFAIVNVNTLYIDSTIVDLNCDSLQVNWAAYCSDCISQYWDFGDGNNSTSLMALNTYAGYGPFEASFTGISSQGCVGMRFFEINLDSCWVNSPTNPSLNANTPVPGSPGSWTSSNTPPSNIIVPENEYCAPITLSIANPVPNAQNWIWHFGDGTVLQGFQPQHTYSDAGLYSIMLEFEIGGVLDTMYYHYFVQVNGHENQIVVNSINNCNNLDANILSQNTGLMYYNWNLNNHQLPIDSYSFDTTFVNSNQLHSIVLTTIDSNFCTYSTSAGIIAQGISPVFTFDSVICVNDTLTISHTIPHYMQAVWNFGDGYTGTYSNHVYNTNGVYQVSVTALDTNGCVAEFNVGEVVVNSVNGTFMYSSPSSLCVGDTIYFSAQDVMNDSYTWSLTNVTMISTEANGVGIVNAPGIFDIALETSNHGCVATSQQQSVYTVNQAQADFSFNQDNLCLPITSQFTDLSPSAVSWEWDFGDGDTSQVQNPVHVYNTQPNGQVSLTIVDNNGCEASISKNNIDLYNTQLNISGTFGCAPEAIEFSENSQNTILWEWAFGDGSIDSVAAPNHLYTDPGVYDVTLVTTSADGCVDTVYHPALVEIDFVVADFTSSVNMGCAPQPAFFTNSSQNATSWEWTFGNGATSSQENPVQVYYVGGNYNIQLIAQSASGCLDTLNATIDILGPNADFSLLDTMLCQGENVSFLNNSQGATSFSWLFGDGNSSNSAQPVYQYANSGVYDITLIALDDNGCQNIQTQTLPITINNLPDPTFTISDTIGCDPLPISLSSVASSVSVQWLINGSTVSTNMNYNTNLVTGNYNISMIATSTEGCMDSSAIQIVDVLPVNSIQIDPIGPVCETTPSITVNSSVLGGEWTINGAPNATNQFDLTSLDPGDYTLIQEVNTMCGDIDSVVLHIDSMITATIQPTQVSCENDLPFQLVSSSNLGYWSGPGVINPYNGLFDPSNANHGVNQLTYTIMNGSCLFVDSTSVIVNRIPDANFSVSEGMICEGNSLSITSPVNSVSTTYDWLVWNDMDSIYSNSISPEFDLDPGNWSIALEVVQDGCVNLATLNDIVVLDTLAPNSPDIIRSTVVEDEAILTEWEDPAYGDQKILNYHIWRSNDSMNFSIIETVDKNERSFIDYSVDVHQDNYYYLVVPQNVCNVKPEGIQMSSSILLKKEEVVGDQLMFNWTEYYKWKEGVDYYELQRLNEFGEWETIETVDSTKHSVVTKHP